MTYGDVYRAYYREMNQGPQGIHELYLVPHGERWGWSDDEVYVGSYWNKQDAQQWAERILDTEMSAAPVDCGHGRQLVWAPA